MTTTTTVHNGNGVGFFSVLFFIFLVLKLTGAIAWSWWWVTAPLWIPTLVGFSALVLIGIVSLLIFALKAIRE